MGKYATGDVVRLATKWKYALTEDQVLVHHVKLSGTVSADDDEVEFQLKEWLEGAYATMLTYMSSSLAHESINILIEGSFAATTILGPDTDFDGQDTNQSLPPQDTALVLFRTAHRGTLGRKYLPVFTEPSQAAGVWTDTAKGDILDMAGELSSPTTGAGGLIVTPVVYSKDTNTAWPIVEATRSEFVCTQRRRKRGRGS